MSSSGWEFFFLTLTYAKFDLNVFDLSIFTCSNYIFLVLWRDFLMRHSGELQTVTQKLKSH